ncbi:MAG: motility protein A [Deltaproteobacteria bacterium]|nr:motility protein A [Deltaproteobacteria bacterium]
MEERPIYLRSDLITRQLDHATLFGVGAAFGLVVLAIALGGGGRSFFDLNSILIVGGGTIGVTLINFPLGDFLKTLTLLKTALVYERASGIHRLKKLVDMARRVRADGALAIEDEMFKEADPFMQKAMGLLADNNKAEEIRRTLEIELTFLDDRHRHGSQLFQTMGTISPAMGLIGTLIGLVQMLSHLDDPSQIGPAMAVALLTTFYGAMAANIVFLPLAGKLRAKSKKEMLIKEMTIEGLVCISEGLHPRIIEQRLLSFLPPEERSSDYD